MCISLQSRHFFSPLPLFYKKKKINMYENENKQEKRTPLAQKFYFNEEGKLVVETNKGVWVDGEQYAKMYGIFTCNAKTMGEIIHKMKGIPVEIGVEEFIRFSKDEIVDELLNVNDHTVKHYCILGVNNKRVDEYEVELAKKHWETRQVTALNCELKDAKENTKLFSDRYNEASDKLYSLKKDVKNFNNLPWYIRIFKKIKIDEK